MTADVLYFGTFILVLLCLAYPLGGYMARIYMGQRAKVDQYFAPIENLIYHIAKVDCEREMDWKQYASAVVIFNIFGFLAVFIFQLIQHKLPLNPAQFGPVTADLAFNTAVSFMTNTNWQAYAGESTMSYWTQMFALTVQNFLSAATGIAVAVALIRGLTRRTTNLIGNFWVDLTKTMIRVLLPLSVVMALVFVQQGVIQNFASYQDVVTMEGAKQTVAMGPVASQEAIKLLGTNGGGFFNANSSHPFENPTSLTNYLQALSIFLIPTALVFTFGKMTKNKKQGYVILGAMLLLFCMMLGLNYASESYGNPMLANLGLSGPTAMEGKEVRFGIAGSSLFATVTTAASCGAVNSMHDSYMPLGGLAAMLQMMLGEVIIGGVGAGFYGMMVFVILTVFIIGLMVGRTPEYLGKKVEVFEMKMATLAVLVVPVAILAGSAIAATVKIGTQSVFNSGPHGLSEILYAFSSGAGNNGSAFAGLNANTLFYNLMIGVAMLIGRFGVILPVLALAGSMAQKKVTLPGAGTFATDNGLFMMLIVGVVLIVGALTFLPALALGPLVEHLQMLAGKLY